MNLEEVREESRRMASPPLGEVVGLARPGACCCLVLDAEAGEPISLECQTATGHQA